MAYRLFIRFGMSTALPVVRQVGPTTCGLVRYSLFQVENLVMEDMPTSDTLAIIGHQLLAQRTQYNMLGEGALIRVAEPPPMAVVAREIMVFLYVVFFGKS